MKPIETVNGRKKIMIIDTNPQTMEMIALELNRHEYITISTDAARARTIIENSRPHAVLVNRGNSCPYAHFAYDKYPDVSVVTYTDRERKLRFFDIDGNPELGPQNLLAVVKRAVRYT